MGHCHTTLQTFGPLGARSMKCLLVCCLHCLLLGFIWTFFLPYDTEDILSSVSTKHFLFRYKPKAMLICTKKKKNKQILCFLFDKTNTVYVKIYGWWNLWRGRAVRQIFWRARAGLLFPTFGLGMGYIYFPVKDLPLASSEPPLIWTQNFNRFFGPENIKLPGREKLCPGKLTLGKILSEISGQYFYHLGTEFFPLFLRKVQFHLVID